MSLDPELLTGAAITILGTVLGVLVTFGATYYTSILSEKQDKNKTKRELEIKSLEEIYSPLIFLIDKTRNIYASIIALQNTINNLPVETLENVINEFDIANKLITSDMNKYYHEIENLLKTKIYLIDSKDYYRDLFLFISYLDTLNDLFMQVKFNNKIKETIDSFRPLITTLEGVTANLREYAIAKTSYNEKYKYALFFTDELYQKTEKQIDDINIQIHGIKVIPWEKIIKERIDSLPP